jgi:hypothetical protein
LARKTSGNFTPTKQNRNHRKPNVQWSIQNFVGLLLLREPRKSRAAEHILCKVSLFAMARTECTDRVVGAILASWRYDISGIFPEMRKDYEQHFAECPHCRARQKFHRSLDVTLAVLTSLSVFFFLFALAVLIHIKPLEYVSFNILGLDTFDMYHMLVSAAIAGVCFSVIGLALVLTATPVPSYLGGIAAERAKLLEERLPAAIKSLRPR